MARLARLCSVVIPQHIIQRGNNRQICFNDDEDFAAYAHWLKEFSDKYHVNIHAWVFMTNHVHLLATPTAPNAVSLMMQSLGKQYLRYYNHTYKRTGTLWEGRYKSCVVQTSEYLLHCYRYIELNPVRAGMVNIPEDYAWSSYAANALGREASLRTPHSEYLNLGHRTEEREQAYRDLFLCHFDSNMLGTIRSAVAKNLALGDERFKVQIEENHKRRVTVLKVGRKRNEP